MSEAEILTNIEFDFLFNGKTYKIKKATLRQVIDFQRKVADITKDKDPSGDLRMAAYAIYLALHAIDNTITEDDVLDKMPGDIDVMDVFARLGFMSQQKVELMAKLRNSLAKDQSSGENSSQY